jgi:ATP-dependent RNA helicase DHX8/PRP22
MASGDRPFAQDVRSRGQARQNGVPEWKRETMGKNASFGRRTNLSIREQREGLPIFKLRQALINAVTENQILVVIGDTGYWLFYRTTEIIIYIIRYLCYDIL